MEFYLPTLSPDLPDTPVCQSLPHPYHSIGADFDSSKQIIIGIRIARVSVDIASG